MRKNKNNYKLYAICIVFPLIILLIGSSISYKEINEKIVVEAGSELPKADVFLKDVSGFAEYVTDTSQLNLNLPGTYDIKIQFKGRKYKVKLEVQDTTAPKAQTNGLDLYEARTVKPQEFIKTIIDATDVTITYKAEPDYSLTGNQKVELLLEDTSGNKSEYEVNLRISKVLESSKVEINDENFSVDIFLKDKYDASRALFTETSFVPSKLGTFPIFLSIDNIIYDSKVEVVDTIPPTGTTVDRTFWSDEEFCAADFVTEIVDATNVSVSFLKEPDLRYAGDQKVEILLTDQGNNQSVLEANLTLIFDTEPPIIYGAEDKTIFLNKPVAYKKGIYVVDNRDNEIEAEVDSSRVNIREEGSYKVIYSATDSSGNTTKKEVTYTVINYTVDPEEVIKMADEILARIIKDNMTLREKALAIYKYINKNVYYIGVSHKVDIITEAYYGMLKSPGDCYTYFAVSDLMLNRVGIPNIRVERLKYEGESNHYWHMINCGDGWYHFDPSIHKPEFFSFMLTDAEAEEYSRKRGKNAYYYRHDKEKYPATPEK